MEPNDFYAIDPDLIYFYTIDLDYITYIKKAEIQLRDHTRVPDFVYPSGRKQKFVLGPVLTNGDINYFVPVSTHYQPDLPSLPIEVHPGAIKGYLRFCYMIPVPLGALSLREIDLEPDQSYRARLEQQLRFCLDNQDQIYDLAQQTYECVISGEFPDLKAECCDFLFLEEKCREYTQQFGKDLFKHSSLDIIIARAQAKVGYKSTVGEAMMQARKQTKQKNLDEIIAQAKVKVEQDRAARPRQHRHER